MTNPLTNDPFYKRVKDALIIIFAIYTLWPSVKERVMGAESTDPVSIAVLKSSFDEMKFRQTRLEDKVDKILLYMRRDRDRSE